MLEQAGLGLNSLKLDGICWNMVDNPEMGWNMLKSAGNRLEETGTCWNRLEQI